jgi:hypothetical protein
VIRLFGPTGKEKNPNRGENTEFEMLNHW